MDIGSEQHWREGLPPPIDDEDFAHEAPPAPEEEDGDGGGDGPPFHREFLKLCEKHKIQDFFYVALGSDGDERLMTFRLDVLPGRLGYRRRASRLCFEARGLLQFAEGSLWPSNGMPEGGPESATNKQGGNHVPTQEQ